MATSIATPLVTATLDQALFTRRRGSGIAGSIGSVGDALDNALMESTIGLYKTELIDSHPHSWTGRGELERETASWVHWFNTSRRRSSIQYCSPVEWEQHYHHRTTTTPSALEVA